MSRWDALKPDLKKISSGSSRVTPRNESKSKHRTTPASSATNGEVLLRYRALVRSCQSGSIDVSVLTGFLTEHAEAIPPEENANAVVDGILLSFLNEKIGGKSLESNDLTLSTDPNCHDIINCISVLLRNAKHCSAILAPLTDRILENGVEKQLVNPVRIRLFDLLHKSLTIFPSCVICFVAALEGTKHVDESSVSDSNDLQLWFIQSYLAHWQEHGEDKNEDPLLLVQALVNCRPGASIALCKSILLRRRRGSKSPCQRCGLSEPPKLLNLIHCKTNSSTVAIRCVTGLFLNLPLQRWLSSTGTRMGSGHSWTFRDKVVCLLEDVLSLLRCVEYESDDFTKLCVAVLNRIPFHDEQHLTSLGEKALDHISFAPTFRNILMACFGGRMTPNGSLTTTPLPIQNWLHSNLHYTQQLFDDDRFLPGSFICAVCRSNPSVVLNHRTTWDMFGSAVARLSTSNPDLAAEVVESLLEGRSNADNSEYTISPEELVRLVLPSMDRFLFESERCQLASCRGFGSLLECDWEEIPTPSQHLARISNLCRGPDLVSKVKSEGYRALGRICSRLLHTQSLSFDGEGSSGTKLTNELLAVVNVSDSKVPIRSMALFTAGNLFQAIHRRGILAEGVDLSLFLSTISLLQATLKHKDEKVAVNALRTSGIVCCLLLSEQFWCHRVGLNTLEFVDTVLSSCDEALCAVVSGTATESTTWKKRLGAKKKGRAACRCLELIFKSIPLDAHECWSLCCGPVVILFRTLPQIHLVDRKLAAAVLATLRSVENLSFLENIEPNLTGNPLLDALVGTVLLLFSTASSAEVSSMREDLEATLLHFLSLVNETVSASLLRRLGRDRSEEFLLWLSARDAHSTILQRFANAAGSVSLDIQVQLLLVRGIGLEEDGPDEL